LPANVAATAGNKLVTITWANSGGATGYNVKRSTVTGGPYTNIASPTVPTYADSAVNNQTTYYYVVSALNAGGESANSAQVSATPEAPSTAAASSVTPPVAGYVLKFDDEFSSFNGNAAGSNGWQTTYPFNGARSNNPGLEAECDVDPSVAPGISPFSIVSGGLQIQATLASVTGANVCGLPYSSGLIASANSFYLQYGYIEMKAQLPAGAGMWPAFWLVPTNFSWPPEIDIFEQIGNPTQIVETLHYVSNGSNTSEAVTPTVANTTIGFHTYAVDWEPQTTTFYVDGVQTGQFATPPGMNQAMYIIAQLSIGGQAGSWAGVPTSNSEFPANMVIAYIRAWASPNSTNIGGSLAQ
jgi:Glycosyl hydrolases family 16